MLQSMGSQRGECNLAIELRVNCQDHRDFFQRLPRSTILKVARYIQNLIK